MKSTLSKSDAMTTFQALMTTEDKSNVPSTAQSSTSDSTHRIVKMVPTLSRVFGEPQTVTKQCDFEARGRKTSPGGPNVASQSSINDLRLSRTSSMDTDGELRKCTGEVSFKVPEIKKEANCNWDLSIRIPSQESDVQRLDATIVSALEMFEKAIENCGKGPHEMSFECKTK